MQTNKNYIEYFTIVNSLLVAKNNAFEAIMPQENFYFCKNLKARNEFWVMQRKKNN